MAVTARSRADLLRVAEAVGVSGLPLLVVGRGSNLLVADAGFGGIAVSLHPDGFGELAVGELSGAPVVRAGGALALPALARRSVEAGLRGLEWAVGVPGSVGGGVRMNAGGHGSDMAAAVVSATVVDLDGEQAGRSRRLPSEDLGLGYRRSSVAPGQVVVAAELAVVPGDPEEGRETIRGIVRWRREHQPGGQNAGSVFTNPPPQEGRRGPSAGQLVEEAGLKGLRLGSASVSPKHANFVQADPGGSADDVYRLVRAVQYGVADRLGVELRTEVRLVGFQLSISSGGSW